MRNALIAMVLVLGCYKSNVRHARENEADLRTQISEAAADGDISDCKFLGTFYGASKYRKKKAELGDSLARSQAMNLAREAGSTHFVFIDSPGESRAAVRGYSCSQ